jgi:hypothetical protein
MFATLKRLLGLHTKGTYPDSRNGHKHHAAHDPWDGSPMPYLLMSKPMGTPVPRPIGFAIRP